MVTVPSTLFLIINNSGYIIIKKTPFYEKEVFEKQYFSSALEFQSKMLFFLTFKRVE
jgi:hypothetical protein